MASWRIFWSILWFLSSLGRGVRVASLSIGDHAPPGVVSLNLTVANKCVAPDGFPRVAILVAKGGEEPTLPGPVISGNKGDRFLINVTDELTDTSMLTGTSIHWHGLSQHHSNQMDGTAYVTQCPIYPGNSFLYNFTGGNQVGTYWYHSHFDVQYCDGLRGAFVIRDPDDPYKNLYDYDNDSTIISLMDWYHYPSPVTPRQVWPDSVLINGTGCYENGSECPSLATYMVEGQKRYRFRLLNMSCKTFFNFSIDDHTMMVIEVDGESVEPYTVDSIQIFAGQRYSFILNANQSINNYWMRAIPSPGEGMVINSTHNAILRYTGAPNVDPQTTNVTTTTYLNETLLRSFAEPNPRLLQPEADVMLNVVLGKDDSNYNFLINGMQYVSPTVPVLLQIMNRELRWEIDPTQSIYLLPRNKTVELTFHVDGTGGRPHPFHLHGHHFAVIKSADSEYRNYDRPVMRDTISTGSDDVEDGVTIRFITDNPGPWILHCHIEWHLYVGMAIVFVEDYADIRADQPFNNATRDLCPYYNPTETFTLPPPRETAGPYFPSTTSLCTPTPFVKRVI
ncbi:laccase [Chiua virens]|nr:laccase [Chiua virens]